MSEEEEEIDLPVVEEEVNDYKQKYLRLLADMENMRKRMQKEKQEMTRFAVDNVMQDLILPIDNLENALRCTGQMSEETRNWAIGFEMILGQFKSLLSEQGIVSFDSKGALFDPHLHEAVEVEETEEQDEGVVLQEFVRGYRSGDRILRPARVKVSKKPNLQEIK